MWSTGRGGTLDTAGRALVHEKLIQGNPSSKSNSVLLINYAGDFGAGTQVQSNLSCSGTFTSGDRMYATGTNEVASFAGRGTDGCFIGFYLNGFGTNKHGFIGYGNSSTNSMQINSSPTGDVSIVSGSWVYLTGSTTYCSGLVNASSFNARSDSRIKTNITDMSGQSSLESLRNLKPSEFTFIANEEQNPTYGFIAQEVKQIVPKAVSISSDFIPSIYEMAFIDDDKKTITFIHKTTDLSWTKLKIAEERCDVAEIINDKTLRIKTKINQEKIKLVDIYGSVLLFKDGIYRYKDTDEVYNGLVRNGVFVYGHEVPDLHSIDYNIIMTVTTKATQELDKQLQDARERIAVLEKQVSEQQQFIADAIQQLNKRIDEQALIHKL
jgi:hypothetical protein